MSSTKFVARHGINSLGDLIVTGSITATGGISISGSITSASFAVSASQAQNSNTAASSSFALTASFAENAGGGAGFPYSGSAVITGSLQITNLTGSGVRYVVTDSDGNVTAQQASASILSTQTVTASAGQTSFNITNGYTTGLVNVFVNGTKLNESEYIDTNGTSITFLTASMLNDVVEFQKYFPASGVTNNALRSVNYFTAVASQSVFSASYTPGLLDVFYNGSKLSNTDYTANNGSAITLDTASAAGDIIEIDVYSYQVGAFSGIGGEGTSSQVPYFNTSNAITGSPNFTFDGSTVKITGSLIITGSNTFINYGSTIFSGSVTAVDGFSGTASNATSASQAQNAVSSSFATTSLTSSFANNLTVAGTITAQTLNVQQVTSSVIYSSGSNVFGNSLSNTQVFTGSVSMTGSLSVNGATTLTTLSGTSATFSGNVTAQGGYFYGQSTNSFVRLDNSIGTQIGYLNYADITFDSDGFRFYTGTGTSGSRTQKFFIASTGAATFSSSVTAAGRINSGNGGGATASLNAQQLSGDDSAIYAGGVATAGSSKGIKILAGTNTSDYALNVASYANSPILYARGDGNVGIGTSSPSAKLHIAQSSSAVLFSESSSVATIIGTNAAGNASQELSLRGFPLTFTGNGGGGAEAMRITSGGNVGIGTSSPFNSVGYTVLDLYGSSVGGHFLVRSPNVTAEYLASEVLNEAYIGTRTNSSLVFRTNLTERMRILADGPIRLGSTTNYVTVGNDGGGVYMETTGSVDARRAIRIQTGNFNLSQYSSVSIDGANQVVRFSTANIERMRITSGGQVQIKQGSNAFSDGLRLINSANAYWGLVAGGDTNLYLGYNSPTVSIGVFNSSTGVYTATSDINKKKDFEDSVIGLNAILGLKPTLYRMKNEDETAEKHLGFIAQEVKEFIPQAYSENINGDNVFIGLTEMPIIAALVKGMQELKAEKDAEIAELRSQIDELKALIAAK